MEVNSIGISIQHYLKLLKKTGCLYCLGGRWITKYVTLWQYHPRWFVLQVDFIVFWCILGKIGEITSRVAKNDFFRNGFSMAQRWKNPAENGFCLFFFLQVKSRWEKSRRNDYGISRDFFNLHEDSMYLEDHPNYYSKLFITLSQSTIMGVFSMVGDPLSQPPSQVSNMKIHYKPIYQYRAVFHG